MGHELDSQRELQDFIENHQLRDNESRIFFEAIVSIITTENNLIDERMNVIITINEFNSYGRLILMPNHLDSGLYPTGFEARWQQMKHVGNQYLQITDIHKTNPKIGEYEVRIVPI